MATMHVGEVFFAAFGVFCVQRHLQARHMYYSVSSGSSGLVWTDTFLVPIDRRLF